MPTIGVYGSLRQGMSNHAMLSAHGTTPELLAMVSIPGRLFSFGDYCGIVPHPTETVVGEVYEVSDSVFKTLDAMERDFGYEAREVTTDGRTFLVWYYQGDPGREATRIAGGDWVKFLDLPQRRA